MSFLIKYDDGFYNYGPLGTKVNGFPVRLEDATRYETISAAEEKACDLYNPDGTGVMIVEVGD